MKKLCYLLMFTSFFSVVACKNQEKKIAGPEIGTLGAADPGNIDSAHWTSIQWLDSVVDKGTINEGEKLEVLFRFKNTGDKPLYIKDARPSCGCTVAEKPLEPIAPGKEGLIKAAFDSQNRPGPQHKTITVTANTKQASYYLSFTVAVNKKS